MVWKNDPALGAIPHVGHGSVDIARRTLCGEAVVFDGKDVAALVDFLGDASLVAFEGKLYHRNDDGQLNPSMRLVDGAVVVKPPAGDWFVINEAELMQEYAIVVTVPNQLHQGVTTSSNTTGKNLRYPDGTISHTVDLGKTPAKKAPVKKAPVKKAPTEKARAKVAAARKPAKK